MLQAVLATGLQTEQPQKGFRPGNRNHQESQDISCTKKDQFLFGEEANEETISVGQLYKNYEQ